MVSAADDRVKIDLYYESDAQAAKLSSLPLSMRPSRLMVSSPWLRSTCIHTVMLMRNKTVTPGISLANMEKLSANTTCWKPAVSTLSNAHICPKNSSTALSKKMEHPKTTKVSLKLALPRPRLRTLPTSSLATKAQMPSNTSMLSLSRLRLFLHHTSTSHGSLPTVSILKISTMLLVTASSSTSATTTRVLRNPRLHQIRWSPSQTKEHH